MTILGASSAPPSPAQQSPWRSPVPYLFGGLSAMLVLIAFALLMLACSYWKLTGNLENLYDGERDLEEGDADGGAKQAPPLTVVEEKYLVIMAGQEKPSFLATPAMSSWDSSFGSKSTVSIGNSENTLPLEENYEKKLESSVQIEMGNMEAAHLTALDQVH